MVLKDFYILASKTHQRKTTKDILFIRIKTKHIHQLVLKLVFPFQPFIFSYINNSLPGINSTISCANQGLFVLAPFISLNKKE